MNAANAVAARLRVIVMHRDAIVAAGLATTLSEAAGLDVVWSAERGASTLAHDTVIVSDQKGGLEILARWTRDFAGTPRPKVLIVADELAEGDVREALRLGVLGYSTVDTPLEEIVDCTRAVGRGARYLGERVSRVMQAWSASEALTTRETDVLTLLARGLCNKSIAHELNIAIATVKTHLSSVLAKLAADSRCHAVALAARRGLV
jgi:DNA-binding NarL/FixJ family response regulator